MNKKITTPKAMLIGTFMIAETIINTSGNISNPIIGTAQAEINKYDLMGIEHKLKQIIDILYDINISVIQSG